MICLNKQTGFIFALPLMYHSYIKGKTCKWHLMTNYWTTECYQYTRPVMVLKTDDSSWRIATTHHRLSICDILVIQHRPLHLYECLWCHYVRTRNIVSLLLPVQLCCLQVNAICHDPSPLLASCYRSGVLNMYGLLRVTASSYIITTGYQMQVTLNKTCHSSSSGIFVSGGVKQ